MKKKINARGAKLLLTLFIRGARGELESYIKKYPEDRNGVEIDSQDVIAAFDRLSAQFARELEALIGEVELTPEELYPSPSGSPSGSPSATPSPKAEEPNGSNEILIRNTGAKMSWNSYYYDKFVFPKCGPEYTSDSFEIVYSDGNRLYVRDPKHMVMTPDNMKYQPGGQWSGNNPDIPTMEVYARRDTHPEWVKAVFKHKVR